VLRVPLSVAYREELQRWLLDVDEAGWVVVPCGVHLSIPHRVGDVVAALQHGFTTWVHLELGLCQVGGRSSG
jgi:hypothetical protein